MKQPNGMDEAFSALIGSYAGLVYAAARSVLSSFPAEEAEDCAADVFLYIYERREALDLSSPKIKGYLAKAAKSFAYSRVRKLRREASLPFTDAELAAAPVSNGNKPFAQDKQRALVEAVLSLGEPDSSLIMRRYYFCESTKAISRETGMKVNTVDQRVRRARIRLMTVLKGLGFHDAE